MPSGLTEPDVGDGDAGIASKVGEYSLGVWRSGALRKPPLRQKKSWKGEWKCNLKPFEAIRGFAPHPVEARPPAVRRQLSLLDFTFGSILDVEVRFGVAPTTPRQQLLRPVLCVDAQNEAHASINTPSTEK